MLCLHKLKYILFNVNNILESEMTQIHNNILKFRLRSFCDRKIYDFALLRNKYLMVLCCYLLNIQIRGDTCMLYILCITRDKEKHNNMNVFEWVFVLYLHFNISVYNTHNNTKLRTKTAYAQLITARTTYISLNRYNKNINVLKKQTR